MSLNNREYDRKSIRLAGHDYAGPGAYFITLNVSNRQPVLGTIRNGVMYPTATGKIVHDEWIRTALIRPECNLDAFVIMPDHFHAIIWIHDVARGEKQGVHGTPLRTTRYLPVLPISEKPGPYPRSLGSIVAGFKSACTRRINAMHPHAEYAWQRNFYERVIRTEDELERIRHYIVDNPRRWHPRMPADKAEAPSTVRP